MTQRSPIASDGLNPACGWAVGMCMCL